MTRNETEKKYRIVKFRGFGFEDQKWHYGHLVQNVNGSFFIYEHVNETSMEKHLVRESSLGEYLGIFDKAKTEIYEGDILQLKMEDGELVKVLVFRSVNEAGFGVEELDGWDPMTQYGPFRNVKDKKVIGNSFQHKFDKSTNSLVLNQV